MLLAQYFTTSDFRRVEQISHPKRHISECTSPKRMLGINFYTSSYVKQLLFMYQLRSDCTYMQHTESKSKSCLFIPEFRKLIVFWVKVEDSAPSSHTQLSQKADQNTNFLQKKRKCYHYFLNSIFFLLILFEPLFDFSTQGTIYQGRYAPSIWLHLLANIISFSHF